MRKHQRRLSADKLCAAEIVWLRGTGSNELDPVMSFLHGYLERGKAIGILHQPRELLDGWAHLCPPGRCEQLEANLEQA